MQPNISRPNQRRYYRHPVSVPIKFKEVTRAAAGRSSTVDVSEGGICFLSDKFLAKGTSVKISIPVNGQVFDLEGSIAYCNSVANIDFYRTGVAFSNPTSTFKAKLAEQMLEIKKYQKAVSKQLGYEVSEEEAAHKWIEKYAQQFSQLF